MDLNPLYTTPAINPFTARLAAPTPEIIQDIARRLALVTDHFKEWGNDPLGLIGFAFYEGCSTKPGCCCREALLQAPYALGQRLVDDWGCSWRTTTDTAEGLVVVYDSQRDGIVYVIDPFRHWSPANEPHHRREPSRLISERIDALEPIMAEVQRIYGPSHQVANGVDTESQAT